MQDVPSAEGGSDDDDDDSDEEEESDEETPKKVIVSCLCLWPHLAVKDIMLICYRFLKPEPSKKRPGESTSKTPIPDKKAKLATPQQKAGMICAYDYLIFMRQCIQKVGSKNVGMI